MLSIPAQAAPSTFSGLTYCFTILLIIHKDANQKRSEKAEAAAADTYQRIEDAVVGGYQKVKDTFVGTFLARDGETLEEAKERLSKK